jgi:mycothiol synthase
VSVRAVRQGLPDSTAVRALAARVEARDGAPPLSDQALAQLQSSDVIHFTVAGGYAQLCGDTLEIAADETEYAPLLDAAEASTTGRLSVWTHGARTPLAAVLESRGYAKARILHQLLLPSLADLPVDPPLPDGVAVRAFVVGQDEQRWLAVNAAAFANHPEQGRWTRADLAAREQEPWFDPSGFLLAERDGQLLGFHWTKVHDDGRGEVYVLGISPAAQGLGLGAGLLVRGLRHLADRGCPSVLLYVDDDNRSAMRLYGRFGFVTHDTDVQWAKFL